MTHLYDSLLRISKWLRSASPTDSESSPSDFAEAKDKWLKTMHMQHRVEQSYDKYLKALIPDLVELFSGVAQRHPETIKAFWDKDTFIMALVIPQYISEFKILNAIGSQLGWSSDPSRWPHWLVPGSIPTTSEEESFNNFKDAYAEVVDHVYEQLDTRISTAWPEFSSLTNNYVTAYLSAGDDTRVRDSIDDSYVRAMHNLLRSITNEAVRAGVRKVFPEYERGRSAPRAQYPSAAPVSYSDDSEFVSQDIADTRTPEPGTTVSTVFTNVPEIGFKLSEVEDKYSKSNLSPDQMQGVIDSYADEIMALLKRSPGAYDDAIKALGLEAGVNFSEEDFKAKLKDAIAERLPK